MNKNDFKLTQIRPCNLLFIRSQRYPNAILFEDTLEGRPFFHLRLNLSVVQLLPEILGGSC